MKEKNNKGLEALSEVIVWHNKYVVSVDAPDREIVNCFSYAMIFRFRYNVAFFMEAIVDQLKYDGIHIFMPSARRAIREAAAAGIISKDESERCMRMLTLHSRASSVYGDRAIRAMAQKIPGYYELMHTICNRLSAL